MENKKIKLNTNISKSIYDQVKHFADETKRPFFMALEYLIEKGLLAEKLSYTYFIQKSLKNRLGEESTYLIEHYFTTGEALPPLEIKIIDYKAFIIDELNPPNLIDLLGFETNNLFSKLTIY